MRVKSIEILFLKKNDLYVYEMAYMYILVKNDLFFL